MITTRLRRAGRYITTYAVVAASGFNEVTDFGICRRQPWGASAACPYKEPQEQ
jgi:hypothetical protein